MAALATTEFINANIKNIKLKTFFVEYNLGCVFNFTIYDLITVYEFG